MRDPLLPAACMWKYGNYPNQLTYYDGAIDQWPTTILGPMPSDAALAQTLADYKTYLPTVVPPAAALRTQIQQATTIADLKAALLKLVP